MWVVCASQPFGALTGFPATFRTMLAVTAMTRVRVLVVLRSNNPGSIATAATPNQAEPGNRMPAETSGDAQPTIHKGGIADRSKAAVVAHGTNARFRVQHRHHGSDKTAVAASHRAAPSALLAGQ